MDELSKYKENILLIKCDLSKEQEVDTMFHKISEVYGKLDGLVNCAAYDKVYLLKI